MERPPPEVWSACECLQCQPGPWAAAPETSWCSWCCEGPWDSPQPTPHSPPPSSSWWDWMSWVPEFWTFYHKLVHQNHAKCLQSSGHNHNCVHGRWREQAVRRPLSVMSPLQLRAVQAASPGRQAGTLSSHSQIWRSNFLGFTQQQN